MSTALGMGAAASSGERAKVHVGEVTKSVKPDFSFYVGKTVTLIVPAAPGGSLDDFARIVAPLMASYLHCNIVIENNAAGGAVAGQDQTAAAPPNGLTIGVLNPGSDVAASATHTTPVDFPIQDVPIIDGTPSVGATLIVQPNYPIRTFTQLTHLTTPIPILVQAGATTLIEIQIFLIAYHVPYRFISGYSSGAAVAAGFLRGDAPMAIQGFTAFSSLITSGKARSLVIATPLGKGTAGYDLMKKVPTFASYAAAHPPASRSGLKAIKVALSFVDIPSGVLFAPVGTPAPLIAALAVAARSALAQPIARTEELNVALKPGYVSPQQTSADIRAAVQREPQLAQYLGA